jgi:hypothetical protein
MGYLGYDLGMLIQKDLHLTGDPDRSIREGLTLFSFAGGMLALVAIVIFSLLALLTG